MGDSLHRQKIKRLFHLHKNVSICYTFLMRYIHAVPGTAIGLSTLILLDLFLPISGPSGDINIILTISTFLFAILIGFFIARLASRYDNIRSWIAQEDALMFSLYRTTNLIDKRLAKQLANVMESYYIVAYDFSLANDQNAYKATAIPFQQMWELVRKVDRKKDGSSFQTLVDHLTNIEQNRNQASVVSQETMRASSWVLLLVLTAIILVSVFYVRTDAFYSHFVTVGLSTALLMLLLILRDLQNMMLGGQDLLDESGQEVLEAIGKRRYYHISFLNGMTRIPDSVREYRVGYHKPGAQKHDIRLVKR